MIMNFIRLICIFCELKILKSKSIPQINAHHLLTWRHFHCNIQNLKVQSINQVETKPMPFQTIPMSCITRASVSHIKQHSILFEANLQCKNSIVFLIQSHCIRSRRRRNRTILYENIKFVSNGEFNLDSTNNRAYQVNKNKVLEIIFHIALCKFK